METQIIKGIVLSSCDYKERDKLVEIYSVELGKITAVLKGCKSPNAKLKFAFQPFCFAEFSIVRLGKFYQIANASLIDSFFNLSADLTQYYVANLILEITSISVQPEEQNPQIFLLLAKVLKNICYDDINPYIVALKYCIDILQILGYKINFSRCSSCGLAYAGKIFLNLDSGEFVCFACKAENSLTVSLQAFSTIKIVSITEYERLNSIKIADSVLKEAINLLCKNLEHRVYKYIRSLKFI